MLTDTDNTYLQFLIISDPASNIPEPKIRDIISTQKFTKDSILLIHFGTISMLENPKDIKTWSLQDREYR